MACKMNFGILRSILRRSQMVSKSFESAKYHTTTTVSVLHPTSKSDPAEKESDPFGLNDEKDLNSLLVQGNLSIKEKPSTTLKNTEEDVGVESRLKKYESWMKYSVNRNSKDDQETENVRKSTYGNVRLDRDNVPTDDYENPDDYQLDFSERKPSRRFVQPENKKDKMATHENWEAKESEPQEITGPISPKRRPEQVYVDAENVDYAEDSPIRNPESFSFMDSNDIPKEYQLVDLNALTHGEMWDILKKSVIFENEYLMAINKPFGIPVQGKSRDCRRNIMQFIKEFSEHCKCSKLFPLHRMDKDTTGVLMFAKDKQYADIISQKFADRQIRKLYLAITKNCPHIPKGTVNIPIGKGKIGGSEEYRSVLKPDLSNYKINRKQKQISYREASTKFSVINSTPEYAFMEVEPESGVKHQMRVHLGLGLSCPILGDHKYSHRDRLAPQRLPSIMLRKLKLKQTKVRELPIHLHCSQISFDLSSELTNSKEPLFIHAKVPNFFNHSLKVLGLVRTRK